MISLFPEDLIAPDGTWYERSQTFLDWAAQYDEGGLSIRSKKLHETWIKHLPCPVLRLDSLIPGSELLQLTLDKLKE